MIAEAQRLLEEIDNLATKEKVKATLESIGKARTKAKKQTTDNYAFVDEERCHRLKRILAIVDQQSKSFADAAVIDESFIFNLTNACYRIVEDGGLNRQKDLKDVVFKTIGICVKRFSHGFQCAIRCFEIIQRLDYGPSFAAELVNLLCISYSNATVLRDVIGEIMKTKPEDLALDSNNVKNICAFLIELSEKYPSLIIAPNPCFEALSPLLDRDPYSMRSAVLCVAAGIVRYSKGLAPEEKDSDLIVECIECLKTHTMDVNAFVRGKALQLLQGLVKELCLPAEEQLNVLNSACDRLCDKSSIVRRYAIQLLTTVVEVNQLAIRLAIQNDGSAFKPENVENAELAAGLAEFAQFSTAFSDVIRNKALPIVSDLIDSKTVSDLSESIEFLILSSEFGLSALTEPILLRSLDNLVLSEIEQPVKAEILQAFERIYVEGRPANVVINNFVRLVSLIQAFSALDGFGEMLTGLYTNGKFPTSFFNELLRQFSSSSADRLRSRQLALIICLLSSVKPPQMLKAVDGLITVGMETSDLLIAKFVVDALCRLLTSETRMKPSHKVFTLFSKVITDSFATTPADVDWFSLFRSSLIAIYELSDNPEKNVTKVMQEMHRSLLSSNDGGFTNVGVTATRFFYAVGEVALRHFMFLDGPILKHMKASAAKSKSKEIRDKKQKPRKSMGADAANTSSNELEMALGCATAPDVESDAVISLLNNLVTDPAYLLTNFVPIISEDATSENPSFATLLCLVKFMLVSQPVAQVLMPVFEKALDKFLSLHSDDASKNSLLVGLADMFIRFPTITGRISQVMFSCLHTTVNDASSSELRQTALIIVSYLAMNDMLRIRDHLADIAVVTLDPDATIRTLSKELITEIATKNNALYNAMANVLSRLAAPISEGGLVEDDKDFDEIISFLFKLVTKDKQTDQLLARILGQMKTASDISFSRRLATCVLHLPLTDRSLSIFHSNFSQFSERLTDDAIFVTLSQALAKLKPSSAAQAKNPELRDQIDELMAKMAAAHDPNSVQVDAENFDPNEEAGTNEAGDAKRSSSSKFATPAPVAARGRGTRTRQTAVAKTPLAGGRAASNTKAAAAPASKSKSGVKVEPAAAKTKSASSAGKTKVVVDSDSD